MARPKSRHLHAKYDQSLHEYIGEMIHYLVDGLGWSPADAREYTSDHDKFKTDWLEGRAPSDVVDSDLNCRHSHYNSARPYYDEEDYE